MEFLLSGVVGQRLNDPNCQTIFRKIEHKDAFAGSLAMLLFPLKDLLHRGMFDDGYALIILEEPLDYIRHGINVYLTVVMPPQWRRVTYCGTVTGSRFRHRQSPTSSLPVVLVRTRRGFHQRSHRVDCEQEKPHNAKPLQGIHHEVRRVGATIR